VYVKQHRIAVNLLLEEDRAETRVESTNTLGLEDLAETANQTVGEARCRDEADTGSLERAEGNGGEELGAGGRDRVDSGTVLAGSLKTENVDRLLLEELVTTKLEGSLDEVTSEGWAEAGQESSSALILDDLAEAANHTTVVGRRVELDTGLDAARESVIGIRRVKLMAKHTHRQE
jgi:hypothetical protein